MNDTQPSPSPSVKSVNPRQSVMQTPPPRYKQTEVGVIPEDWEVKTLDCVGFVTSGKRLPLGSSLTTHETPHPYIRVTDMRPGTVSLADIMFVPSQVFPAIKRYRIFREDIFISVAGTLGIVGKVPQELDGANLTENADRITDITCSQDYLLHVLMSPLIQTTIDSLQTVGAQPKLALARIRKFVVPIPPTLAEQQAIAEALSDVDALTEDLEQLIAKKRQIKQGAMQELLTGKARLPGFSKEWESKRIGDILALKYGRSQRGLAVNGGTYPILGTGGEVGRTNEYLHDGPSVIIGRKGTIDIPQYVDTPFWAIDTTYFSEISESANAMFLFYTFTSIDWYSYNEATGVPSLNAKTVENIEIHLPHLAEQTAIATVLSDMDGEITALEGKLVKARLVKQGMMQELLTGRIRLI